MLAVRLMQTSRRGGSTEMDDIAVAVMPIGVPPTQMVMTLTVEATRRIAWRKSASSWGSASTILFHWRVGRRETSPLPAGEAGENLRHPACGGERADVGDVERRVEF